MSKGLENSRVNSHGRAFRDCGKTRRFLAFSRTICRACSSSQTGGNCCCWEKYDTYEHFLGPTQIPEEPLFLRSGSSKPCPTPHSAMRLRSRLGAPCFITAAAVQISSHIVAGGVPACSRTANTFLRRHRRGAIKEKQALTKLEVKPKAGVLRGASISSQLLSGEEWRNVCR